MKKKEEKKWKDVNPEEEVSELNIEELTDIQGGVEDDKDKGQSKPTCGLGCFQGSGTPDRNTDD